MQVNADPSNNYFIVQKTPVGFSEDGKPRLGTGDVNKETKRGKNRGWLSAQMLLENSAILDNCLLEEWWHTMAGMNYPGENKYHYEGSDNSNNVNPQRGICSGHVDGDHTILPIDINTILKADGKRKKMLSNDGNRKSVKIRRTY